MPTTPYAKLLVSKNGGAPASGAILAVAGDVIQFSAESTVGWHTSSRWEFSFPAGYTMPVGWSSETDASGHTVYFYLGNTPPPPLTLGPWGKYMPRLFVNGGGGQKTDISTAIDVPSTNGLHDLGHDEQGQFGGATEGWAKDQRANLRLVDTLLGGSGSGGITDVTAVSPLVAETTSPGVRQLGILLVSPFDMDNGAMPWQSQAMLDAATPNATAATLAQRDGFGGSSFVRITSAYAELGSGIGGYPSQGAIRLIDGGAIYMRDADASADRRVIDRVEPGMYRFGDGTQGMRLITASTVEVRSGPTETQFIRVTSFAPTDIGDVSMGPDGRLRVNVTTWGLQALPTFFDTPQVHELQKNADVNALDAMPERIVYTGSPYDLTNAYVEYYPDDGLVADDANYATFTVRARDGAGGPPTTLAVISTTTMVGATGPWQPFVAVTLAENIMIPTDTILVTVEISKAGLGVHVPSGKFKLLGRRAET